MARSHKYAQASRAPNALLRGREHDIQLPVVEANLLRSDTAHAINHDQRLRADLVHELAQCLDLAQHTRRRVDVCDSNDLVLLLLERLLHGIELWSVADRSLQLRGLRTVGLQGVSEGVGKVARVEDQRFLAWLDQVRGHLIPAEGAGARHDEWLRGWVCSLEELT